MPINTQTNADSAAQSAADTRAQYAAALAKQLQNVEGDAYQEAEDNGINKTTIDAEMARYDQGLNGSPSDVGKFISSTTGANVSGTADPSGISQTSQNFLYGASPNAAADDTAMFRGDASMALGAPGYQAVGYGNGDTTSLYGQTVGQLTAGNGLTAQQNSLSQYLQMANGNGPTTYQNQYAAQYQQAIDQSNRNAMSLAASAQGSGLQRGAADLAAVNQGAGATQAGAAGLAANDAQAAYAQQIAGIQGYQTGAQALTASGNAVAAQNAGILTNETQLQQQDQLNAANVRNQQQQQALSYQALGQGVQAASQQGGQAYENALLQKYGISVGQQQSNAQIAAQQQAADKAQQYQMIAGGFQAGGAAVGLITGGPGGAVAGAQIGKTTGTALATQSVTGPNAVGSFGTPTGQSDPNSVYADAITKKTQNPNGLPDYAG